MIWKVRAPAAVLGLQHKLSDPVGPRDDGKDTSSYG